MANLKISQLSDAAALTGDEHVEMVQSGGNVKATLDLVRDFVLGDADALVFKGAIDCSTDPDYPAADAGHTYKISVAGKIGGTSGPNVEAGDSLYCITDASAAGTHAAVGANWVIVQANIDGAVTGPASSTDNALARFDGTSGKLLQDSPVTVGDNGEMAGYRANVVDISGTTHTFDAANSGKVHVFSHASGCAATAPNTLPGGWCCTWIQKAGAGQITFAVTGGTLHNRQSHTKSAGATAIGALVCESNAGTAPQVYLGGDTAT